MNEIHWTREQRLERIEKLMAEFEDERIDYSPFLLAKMLGLTKDELPPMQKINWFEMGHEYSVYGQYEIIE